MVEQTDIQSMVQELAGLVRDVERRVQRLEMRIGGAPQDTPAQRQPSPPPDDAVGEGAIESLEFEIGERGLGPVGVAVMLVGITFFINYPFGQAFPHSFQIAIGYLLTAGLFALSHWWRERYPFNARILFAGSLILLYLSTLRLHFFTASPLLTSKGVGTALLCLVPALAYTTAVRRGEQHLAVLALILGLTMSLAVDAGTLSLLLIIVTAAAMVWFGRSRGWRRGIVAAMFLTYATHLLWLFNNPLVGHPFRITQTHGYNLVFLFLYWLLFGVVDLFVSPQERAAQRDPELSGLLFSFVNNAGFLCLLLLAGWSHFRDYFAVVNLLAAACCLGLASLYWLRHQGKLTTAVYACFGYVALSLAIVAHFGSPARFIWLGWQSLLVVSTAVWFRSKLVVVSNIFIYVGILLVYLLMHPPHLSVNLSYAAVALLSARVMNWQRERLDLQTEMMRNIYLISAFVVIPYGLYHGVSASYISLSWVGAAAFYFAMSLILKNTKYRWMAILTMLMTVIYVFSVDLVRLSPFFRILSLLVLGLALLAVSFLYARYRQNAGKAD